MNRMCQAHARFIGLPRGPIGMTGQFQPVRGTGESVSAEWFLATGSLHQRHVALPSVSLLTGPNRSTAMRITGYDERRGMVVA